MVKELNENLAYNSKYREEYLADRNLWQNISDFDKKDWELFFIPKVFRVQPMTSHDYEIYPQFNYQEEAANAIILRIFASLLGFAIPTLLIAVLSSRALHAIPPNSIKI